MHRTRHSSIAGGCSPKGMGSAQRRTHRGRGHSRSNALLRDRTHEVGDRVARIHLHDVGGVDLAAQAVCPAIIASCAARVGVSGLHKRHGTGELCHVPYRMLGNHVPFTVFRAAVLGAEKVGKRQ